MVVLGGPQDKLILLKKMSSYDPIDKALNTQSSEIVGVGVDKTSVDLSNKPEEKLACGGMPI